MLAQLAQGHRCGRSTLDQDVREKTTGNYAVDRRGLVKIEDPGQRRWLLLPISTG